MRNLFLSLLFFSLSSVVMADDIYVSPLGCDTCDGSSKSPFKTLRMALRAARNIRMQAGKHQPEGGITIHLADGEYRLHEPLYVRSEDSGTSSSPTIIKGSRDAVLSGGINVRGWKKEGKLFVAEAPIFNGCRLNFRQMYVNGTKVVKARDVAEFKDMAHIRNVDKKKQIVYVPITPAIKALAAQSKSINGRKNIVGEEAIAEMLLHEMWCIMNLRIKNVEIQGDSAAVTFCEPESTIHFEKPWPSPMYNTKPFVTEDGRTLNLNSAFYITDTKIVLDKPGEWYLDSRIGKIYYYPKAGETLQIMNEKTIVPALETLVKVGGTLERKVHDVKFEGISFKHTTWMRPSTDGHVPLQAGMYLLEGYKLRPSIQRPDRNHKLDNQGFLGRPAAAVTVKNADDVSFDGCLFTQLASSAIDYEEGTNGGYIANNTIENVGGNGIVAGSFSPETFETHLPYDPQDRRTIVDGLIIANNRIKDVTNEDWGTLGICCGYVANTVIANNEISEVSYSGINLGWGWTQSVNLMRGNEVYRNYIHHYAKHMYDCAGIYTLSAQPKTFVEENVVDEIYHPDYVHDPNHWFYLYCDEGSSFITVADNWTPSEKYLKNANGPCNEWINNGPQVADSIKVNAGVKEKLELSNLREKIQIRKKRETTK